MAPMGERKMNRREMSNGASQKATQEEMVAAALNEQGFLFSQLIRDNIKFGVSGKGNPSGLWKCIAAEYPVTASDGSQTRIDLVLQHATSGGFHACVECKRANPLYKQWIFFDKECPASSQPFLYFESLKAAKRPIPPNQEALHGIERIPAPSQCEIFSLYLEVAMARNNRASYTQTMEDGFLQVIRGQTGFMAKQLEFRGESCVTAIPIVVTTAQLFEARFDLENVSLVSGSIAAKDLKLTPITSCAVNYHPDDRLAVSSHFARKAIDVETDIFRQTRTVFVVQSESIIQFLNWLAANIVH
jgi:hypothetical protein